MLTGDLIKNHISYIKSLYVTLFGPLCTVHISVHMIQGAECLKMICFGLFMYVVH